MASSEIIQVITQRIAETFHPQQIVLFGSHAAGNATEDSDIDLLVVMESDLPPRKRNIALKRLFPHRNFSLDAFVYTPQEFLQYRDIPGTLIYNAMHFGKLLHG